MNKIELGYCCISTINDKLKCSQASTKSWLDKNTYDAGRTKLLSKAKSNLSNLEKLLEQNNKLGIKAFRLPEQLLPQCDLGYYDINEFAPHLKRIGAIANKYGMQLSQHPSQYFVLNSTRDDVVDKTIQMLNMFADTLALMELQLTPNLTIHVGAKSGYNTKQDACDKFCEGYARLNDNAKRFLVVENDQNSFTIEDCMYIHSRIGIPVVFDNCHYMYNTGELDFNSAVSAAASTWGNRIPKMHLSSEDNSPRHAHADYITIEDYTRMANAIYSCGISNVFFMLESKMKDDAVIQLRKNLVG